MLNPKALTIAIVIGMLSSVVCTNVLSESQVVAQIQEERKTAEADRLFEQGIQQGNDGRFQEAIQSFQQVLKIYQEIGDRQWEAASFTNIGFAYRQLRQYQQAIEYYQQALKIYQEIGDREGEAKSLSNLGFAYSGLAQYNEARKFYWQASNIFRQVGDRSGVADSLGRLGDAYSNLGQYRISIEYHYQPSLAIFKEIGDRSGVADSLERLGNAYYNLGQYQQAIEYYQQSLAIFEEIGDRGGVAYSLIGLGKVYDSLGQYQQAIEYYQQSLAIDRELGNRSGEASSLSYLGITYDRLGQYQQAIEFYQQSLAIERELGTHHNTASSLNNLGIAYRNLEQYQKAIEFYERSLAIFREIGDRGGIASSLGNLGNVYYDLGQYQKAVEFYGQSLVIIQQINTQDQEAIVLRGMGQALEQKKQLELAIIFLKKSVNIRESIRQSIQGLSEGIQQSYAEKVAGDYRLLAEILLEQDRVLEAQEVIDLLKLQELDDYLRDVRGNEKTAQGIDFWPSEQLVLKLFDKWQITELIDSLFQQSPDSNFENFINSPEVTAEVTKLQRTARGQNLNPKQLVQLQDNLQTVGNAALLYPLILDDRLELVLVTTSGLVRKTVPISRVELNRVITAYRSDITDRRSNPIPNAQRLYEILIQPIIEDLAETEIILYAADGQLRYIPLAALHDGEQWLTQRFVINHITAASLTDFTRSTRNRTKILAAAFSDTGKSYNFQVGDETFSFQGLEFAGKEVALIAKIPGTLALFNQEFSRDKVEPQMDQYSVVHFATHAEFVPGNPHQSFILFGNGDRVTLPDISNWKLPNTDLVVLSACRTAVSDELGNGEEILGFGYQIQRTGAEAAIASLWYVNDGGTQVLMNGFYHSLQQQDSMTKALQKAQIALITNDFSAVGGKRGGNSTVVWVDSETGLPMNVSNNLSHPYYWAPFILIGNGF